MKGSAEYPQEHLGDAKVIYIEAFGGGLAKFSDSLGSVEVLTQLPRGGVVTH